MNKHIMCVDIGGTHLSCAVLQQGTHSVISASYLSGYVDSHADQDSILAQWAALLTNSKQLSKVSIDYMVVSIPGPFDYKEGICLMDGMYKYQSLLYMDVKSYFSELLQIDRDQISFVNDAQAFLLGEVFYNNLSHERVVGLTLGTGLGSAMYEHDQITDLNLGSAPFHEGISEDYISTRGMIRKFESICNLSIKNVKELALTAGIEDQRKEVFIFLKNMLNEFIHQKVSLLNPSFLILGGSIAKAHALFLPDLQKEISIPIRLASFDEMNLFKGLANTIKL